MEYEVILEDHCLGLIVEVRKMIAKGWEPVGGASMTIEESGDRLWTQTMLRRPSYVVSVWPQVINTAAPQTGTISGG